MKLKGTKRHQAETTMPPAPLSQSILAKARQGREDVLTNSCSSLYISAVATLMFFFTSNVSYHVRLMRLISPIGYLQISLEAIVGVSSLAGCKRDPDFRGVLNLSVFIY